VGWGGFKEIRAGGKRRLAGYKAAERGYVKGKKRKRVSAAYQLFLCVKKSERGMSLLRWLIGTEQKKGSVEKEKSEKPAFHVFMSRKQTGRDALAETVDDFLRNWQKREWKRGGERISYKTMTLEERRGKSGRRQSYFIITIGGKRTGEEKRNDGEEEGKWSRGT